MRERLESLNALKQKPWNLELDTWFNRDTNTWHYILKSVSDSKEGVFLAYRGNTLVKESFRFFKADSQASQIMEKLQTVQLKNTLNIKGAEYSLGDFIVRFGSLFERQSASFIVVQILYAPFRQTVVPKEIFQEIMNSLCKPTVEASSSEASRLEEKASDSKKGDISEGSEDILNYFHFHDLTQESRSELSEAAFEFLYFLSLTSRPS